MLDNDPKWIELCAQHKAWGLAQADYIDNGMSDDAKWKRCLKSGNINNMDDNCWTALKAAYPA